jgi:hypothetical protein
MGNIFAKADCVIAWLAGRERQQQGDGIAAELGHDLDMDWDRANIRPSIRKFVKEWDFLTCGKAERQDCHRPKRVSRASFLGPANDTGRFPV